MEKRLSGNQIVIIALAICLTTVLAPVGVYAASVQKVRLVDASAAARAAKIDTSGRVLTKSTVSGVVRTRASGTVSARPAPPTQPLHREDFLTSAEVHIIGDPIPKGKNLAIGSVHAMWSAAGGWSQVQVRKAQADGTCSNTGTVVQVVTNMRLSSAVPHGNIVFPVPQVVRATDRALCLAVSSAIEGQIVVDGYLY